MLPAIRPALVWAACFLLTCALTAADRNGKDVVLGDCLVLPLVGQYGRAPVHVDALEAQIVPGRWKVPAAGDKVPWATGVRTWETATAKDGAVEHAALRGGYLYWRVAANTPRVMLLEASGHLTVYVNGEPRAGDPYQNGIVRLPIQLKKGDNDLLFHVGRGRLAARLTPAPKAALLHTHDLTAPDVLPGDGPLWVGVVVVNASDRPLTRCALRASCKGADAQATAIDFIAPLSIRKVAIRVPSAGPGEGEKVDYDLTLVDRDAQALDTAKIALTRRRADQGHKRTFKSSIDDSVQYYAVQPARPGKETPGLVLSLHGAAVEATGQAGCYSPKPWGHVVAPTNRRPFGFDWEDWGRLDALEVLEIARRELKTEPRRTWLTGHSMGGHGTWHLGVTYPDRFAAIAPSAGWVSFWSYAGGFRPEKPDGVQGMFLRAGNPSDTPALARNCAAQGVYVLHGDRDDNVPVDQARFMRRELGAFHPDFVYYERPGAGHWWGNECMDWPALMEFLSRHELPRIEDVPRVDFITASPGISERCHWATVEAQAHALRLSTIHLTLDREKRRFAGTTENVARLALDVDGLKAGAPLSVELDGQAFDKVAWPAEGRCLHLVRDGGKWSVGAPAPEGLKGPRRYGPFKEVFRNRVMFVYGTRGTEEEQAWALAKARYDAETFWYRGNGSIEVVPDTAFDPAKDRDRNVVLYGNADTNQAYAALVGAGLVTVNNGRVQVGERKEEGDNLACLFIRPRPGSSVALVGVVGGTGIAGMRLTDRLSYFVSGCGYPDCLVLGPEVLSRGMAGVMLAGFFGMDWGVASGDWAGRMAP